MLRTLVAIVLLSAATNAAARCSQSGCELEEAALPRYVFEFLTVEGQRLARFDSAVDEILYLPAFLQTPMPDGSFVISYPEVDRRASYGLAEQLLSIQFSDLFPPDGPGKHPEGRADGVPVGESRGLLNWTGRATFLTVTGRILDDPLNVGCQWFCTIDVEYRGNFPDASPSWARIKTLYDGP